MYSQPTAEAMQQRAMIGQNGIDMIAELKLRHVLRAIEESVPMPSSTNSDGEDADNLHVRGVGDWANASTEDANGIGAINGSAGDEDEMAAHYLKQLRSEALKLMFNDPQQQSSSQSSSQPQPIEGQSLDALIAMSSAADDHNASSSAASLAASARKGGTDQARELWSEARGQIINQPPHQ
jgi:hypothetical protein